MTKPKAIIFDIDGTVATRDAGPDGRGPFDWDRVGEDLPNEPVMLIAKMLAAAANWAGFGADIIFFSGRDERCHKQTVMWLDHHFGYRYGLHMRPEKDNRPDHEVKWEMYQQIKDLYDTVVIVDYRNVVVDMWRDNGITCMQVCSREDGDF